MKLFHQEFGLQTHESWAMIKLKIGLRLKGVSVNVNQAEFLQPIP